eukprot:977272_1
MVSFNPIMAPQLKLHTQCLMRLTLFTILIDVLSGFCIQSHPDSTITFISNNINSDSSIRYLGTTSSATNCQNSCQDFNYLCDTSSSNVIDSGDITFDNANCEIICGVTGDAYIVITDDLVSSEYIIDVELTISQGEEAGMFWKSNADGDGSDISSNYRDYYFGIDPTSDIGVTGYDEPTYNILDKHDATMSLGTRYTIRSHVHDRGFTNYVNGQTHYSSSSSQIPSSWTDSYAGLYLWDVDDVTYHSFKITFPDASDNSDEMVCAAYLYDTNNDNCYGYYGTNYAQLESTISSNSRYDSAIIYSDTCPNPTKKPTPNPTKRPTPQPTPNPTKRPTPKPTLNPSKRPTPTPTKTPTPKPTNPVGTSTCGDFVTGVYNGVLVTFTVYLPYDGDLRFNAGQSTFVVTDIEAFTSLNIPLATDTDNDEQVTIYDQPKGDYKF